MEETAIAKTNNQIETANPTKTIAAVNFDTTTTEGKKKLFNASSAAVSLNESGNTVLHISGLIVCPGERLDRATGELVTCLNTTFIAEEGAYLSQSNGIADSAKRLLAVFGGTIPEEGLDIQIKTNKTNNGNTVKFFELI